ncbi:sensory histidine kinase UhpB [compost metagenome]
MFDVHIETTDSHFILKLKDFGIGYDLKKSNSGIGLNNMKLRAKLIGAELILDSNSTGTSVTIEYPLTQDHEN